MLKIWRAEVRTTTKTYLSLHEAKKWCEYTGSYNPDHSVRWHTSGEVHELRNTVTNFLIGTITPMPVQESEQRYTGEIVYLNVKYAFEKLEKDMTCRFSPEAGLLKIASVYIDERQDRRIVTNVRQFVYSMYQYSVVTLDDAIRLEDDPLKKAAYRVLAGDPQACDLMRDMLKC